MTIRRFVVPVVTDDQGDAEVYSPFVSGKLVSIRYVKAAEDSFTDGVDFAITSEVTGAAIWAEDDVNASATRHPRVATNTTAGSAVTYDGAAAAVLTKIVLGDDRLKIVISDGGDTHGGTFHITLDS